MPKISNILVIDDMPSIKKTLEIVFPEFNFFEAANAKQGISFLNKNKEVDLVLLDYKLPDMNGLYMLKSINDLKRDIKVIMITGHPYITDDAIKLGAYALIAKPIDVDDLQELIWSIFDKGLN